VFLPFGVAAKVVAGGPPQLMPMSLGRVTLEAVKTMISRRGLSFLAAILGFAGSPNAAGAQAAPNTAPLPPPGELVDLGGWRVHLHCTGQASTAQPTVILEAGAGGFSVDWSLVQPEVARFARVCSYDRAGLGWSDLGPHPRTLRQIVWELHTLLQRAGVRPPYVLVGHSYGGILARLFTLTYPSDVAGVVLEESGHERGVAVLQNGRLVRLVETATGRAVPAVRTSDPLRESDIPASARAQIEAAARHMASRALEPPRNKLPSDAQRIRAWAFAQVKHWAANDNPFEAEELAALLARWTGTDYPLGDLPVVVLSRGRGDFDDREAEEEHRRNQAELVRLSRSARQVVAQRSGHEILLDEPELVVQAIRDVIAARR
jgi:pimeloyl-ACP methyl ester carboxylesterase